MRNVAATLCAALAGAAQADDTTIVGLLQRAAEETSAAFFNCTVSIAFANATATAEGVTGFTSLNGECPIRSASAACVVIGSWH